MKSKKEALIKLILLFALTVVVVVLQLLGSTIRIGEFSISLILLPVTLGAVISGPWGGAWLGFVFGTVLMMTGETDAFYEFSPIYTIIATAVRGALTGLAAGFVYRAFEKKNEDLASILASVAAPFVNTGLFIVLCLWFFYGIFESMMGEGNVLRGMIKTYVSINFLIELALSMVLTPVLVRFVRRIVKPSPREAVSAKNRRKLAGSLIVAVILLGVLICGVSSGSGYNNVRSSMKKQYSDTACHIAETARSYFDEPYLEDSQEGWPVHGIRPALKTLCEKMGASEISVFMYASADGGPEGMFTPTMTLKSGDTGDGTLEECAERNERITERVRGALEAGNLLDPPLVFEDEAGGNVIAVLGLYGKAAKTGTGEIHGTGTESETESASGSPVADNLTENIGPLLGWILVSLPMDDLSGAVRSDITNSIVMMICIEVIFISLYSFFVSYRVIRPIKSISKEVSGFVKNRNDSGPALKKIRTRDEIQELAEDIVKMEKDIGTYIENITAITAERERIGAELNVAKKIQADMLPSKFPAFPERTDFDIYASMDPAKAVGGDFYDFFLLDEDHIALIIADVSDKGVPAALFMVVAKTLIKNQASFTRSPKEILEAVNVQLFENNTSKMFVTAWLCIAEISTGQCVAVNAGHEYPAIRGADGGFALLKDQHGFVLGGIRSSKYTEYEFTLEKGGAVFVYTDGVTEATNAAEELFGTGRMIDALNLQSGLGPEGLLRNTRSAIDAFVGDAPQFDDITMLCFKRN